MDKRIDKKIRRLLFEIENAAERVAIVGTMEQPSDLHTCATEYNWDDGFDVPRAIADHPACDRATALLLLWLADPMPFWFGEIERSEYQEEWFEFCETMTSRLNSGHYGPATLHFDPGLTRVQEYKLKKNGVSSSLYLPVGKAEEWTDD